jgi:hypothetical protein
MVEVAHPSRYSRDACAAIDTVTPCLGAMFAIVSGRVAVSARLVFWLAWGFPPHLFSHVLVRNPACTWLTHILEKMELLCELNR